MKALEEKVRRLFGRERRVLGPGPLVTEWPRLKEVVRSVVPLLAMRDDLGPLAFGGTKFRKISALMGESTSASWDTVVVSGHAGSNCVRATAALAAARGCRVIAVVDRLTAGSTGNGCLYGLLGAEVVTVDAADQRAEAVNRVCDGLLGSGSNFMVIPPSAATGLGTIAVAEGVLSALDACPPPETIFLASSSGCTQSGVLLACAMRSMATRVIGVSPDDPAEDVARGVRKYLSQALATLGAQGLPLSIPKIEVDDSWRNGARRSDVSAAIRMVARTEGVLVDPIYVGPAAAAMLEFVGMTRGSATGAISLWHSGGQPALFDDSASDLGEVPW